MTPAPSLWPLLLAALLLLNVYAHHRNDPRNRR
jgi:hypothetical protein